MGRDLISLGIKMVSENELRAPDLKCPSERLGAYSVVQLSPLSSSTPSLSSSSEHPGIFSPLNKKSHK